MCNWAFLARPYGRAWDKYTIYLWTYFISTCKIKWIKLIQFISTFLRSNTAVMHETTRANMFPPVPVIPYYDIQLVIRGRRYAIRASTARKFLRRSLLQYYNCSFVIIGREPDFPVPSRGEASFIPQEFPSTRITSFLTSVEICRYNCFKRVSFLDGRRKVENVYPGLRPPVSFTVTRRHTYQLPSSASTAIYLRGDDSINNMNCFMKTVRSLQ